MLSTPGNRSEVVAWLSRHRFDAVICGWHNAEFLLDEVAKIGIRVPRDLGVAAFALSHQFPTRISGLSENWHDLGFEAVSLLHSLMLSGKRGIPEQRNSILIDGSWRSGKTLRTLRKTSAR